MKKNYKYCTVVPKFEETSFYYYIDCIDTVKLNDYVIAPLDDDKIIGKFTEINYYDEKNVPWPLDEMKSVVCIISKEKYDNYSIAEFLGADESDRYELFEGDRVFIKQNCLIGEVVYKRWDEYCHEFLYKVKPEKYRENWHHLSYTCFELEKVEIIGKIKYVGDKINSRLEPNKVYEVFGVLDMETVRAINDGEEGLYNLNDVKSAFFPDLIFKFEIVEDVDGKLSGELKKYEYGQRTHNSNV